MSSKLMFMKSAITAKYLPEINVHEHTIIGKIYIRQLIDHIHKVRSNPGYISTCNICLDISQASWYDFLKNKEKLINALLNKNVRKVKKRKFAILTSKPEDVVFAELLSIHLDKEESNFIIDIFSAKEKARQWLQ